MRDFDRLVRGAHRLFRGRRDVAERPVGGVVPVGVGGVGLPCVFRKFKISVA